MKLQEIGQIFVVNERAFCFPPDLNAVLTLICKIVNKIRDTLRIFTSTLYGKTKTNTNLDPDPNRYRRRCPDPNARIQKKEIQIKTEEDDNFKVEKYKTAIEVNILNTTRKSYRVINIT